MLSYNIFMQVIISRTAERHYAISINGEGLPPVFMNPAPGYSPVMPHNLCHFVVEAELGLPKGIFAQVKEGGSAGTFQLIKDN